MDRLMRSHVNSFMELVLAAHELPLITDETRLLTARTGILAFMAAGYSTNGKIPELDALAQISNSSTASDDEKWRASMAQHELVDTFDACLIRDISYEFSVQHAEKEGALSDGNSSDQGCPAAAPSACLIQ